MLRIISGKAKNKKILVPGSARPITDRIRTSIMDLIKDHIPDSSVLDIFSGSGSFGLECLSRGAKKAVFIESDSGAVGCLGYNIHNTGFDTQTEVIQKDAIAHLKSVNQMYSIIMLDPPFKMHHIMKVKIAESAYRLLKPNGILILRMPSKEPFPIENRLSEKIEYTKQYGISTVFFFRNIDPS